MSDEAIGDSEKVTVDTRIEHESFDEHVKQKEVQRLKFLLEKTTVYSKFLAEKLKKNEEASSAGDTVPSTNKKADPAEQEKKPFKQPSLVTGGKLKDYQLEGVEWLVSLFENGLNGILADEMGLGKTVQCISFLAFLREQGVWGPFLIVAPLSTIENWVAEVKRFTPKAPVILYHGSQAEREALRAKHLGQPGKGFPIVVTSYEIAMRDRKYLQKHQWKYLIVDEGHRIKNLNCKLIKELKSISTANRLLLTGTPLQNNLVELWSLLNFLLPDIFDDLEDFQSWFDLGDLEGENGILDEESEVAVISNLHTILKPFLLRRLKADVERGLPPKKEYLIYCGLSPAQHAMYQKILTRRLVEAEDKKEEEENTVDPVVVGAKRRRVLKKGQYKEAESDDSFTLSESEESLPGGLSSTEGEDMARTSALTGSKSLQNTLMQLRKVCNHPFLFERPVKGGELVLDEGIVEASGKMRILDTLLPALIKRGHRVLIFSQMSRMLDILEEYLSMRGLQCCRIDGSVPQAERTEQLAKYNGDTSVPVFLLSTRAGGLGINLVAADTVIFYDSDWNPQMDLQAQDRVHRIGQTRPVLIYRLAVANSVETRILERATSKRRLEKMVIHRKQFKGRQQYYRDDRILMEDLQAILQDKDSVAYNGSVGSEHMSLTKADLGALLDRSERTFRSTGEGATDSFKVLPEHRADNML